MDTFIMQGLSLNPIPRGLLLHLLAFQHPSEFALLEPPLASVAHEHCLAIHWVELEEGLMDSKVLPHLTIGRDPFWDQGLVVEEVLVANPFFELFLLHQSG